jgi:hypothetical protein
LAKGLIPEYIESSKTLDIKKANNPMIKWSNELNIQFSREVQMKNDSTPLTIKKMQIIPVRMTIIKKTSMNKNLLRMFSKKNPILY